MIGKIYDSTPSRNSGCDNLAQCQNSTPALALHLLQVKRRDCHCWVRGLSKGWRRNGRVFPPEEERLSAPPEQGQGRNSGPSVVAVKIRLSW